MSCWTHVVGSLYIDIYEELDNPKEYVENKLKNAPKITGSESDADIFVNQLSGYNTWVSVDVEGSIRSGTIENTKNGILLEGGDIANVKQAKEYQTCLVITIVGDLRDRNIKQTCKEIDDFVSFIKSQDRGWDIDYASVVVYDDVTLEKQLLSLNTVAYKEEWKCISND